VATVLSEIVDKARRVDTFVVEIATASQEQSQGIGQISNAVSQMDKITQSNAGNAEETAAAAEELSALARMMHESVVDLRKLVGGAGQDEPPAGPLSTRKPSPVAQRVISPTYASARKNLRVPAVSPGPRQLVSSHADANGHDGDSFRDT